MIYLDYETVNMKDLNIRDTGAHKYVEDCRVTCLAWCKDDGPMHVLDEEQFLSGENNPFLLHPEETFVAHNAEFERLVTNKFYPGKYRWYCTAVAAGAYSIQRSLAAAAQTLNLELRKDPQGLKRIKDSQAEMIADGKMKDDTKAGLLEYCAADVDVTRELFKKLPELPFGEQVIYRADQLINSRGTKVNVEFCEYAVELFAEESARADDIVKGITEGYVTRVTQVKRILEWLNQRGVPAKQLTKESVAKMLDKVEDEDVRTVLTMRKRFGRSSVGKFKAAINRASSDGRIRGQFIMNKAHTGRWAGKGFQLQNMPRPVISLVDATWIVDNRPPAEELRTRFGDDVGAILASCVRAAVVPEEGKKFVVADWAAIECRMLALLSGCEKMCLQFMEGLDLYVELAKVIFDTEEVSDFQRFVGKTAILGLGYGMGVDRFMAQCESFGNPIPRELAEKAKKAYLSQYPEIPQYWRKLEADFKHPTTLASGAYVIPSSRTLYYPGLEWDGEHLTFNHVDASGFAHKKRLWGGMITENVVQAFCRDILSSSLVLAVGSKLDVVMHIHDEIVLESDDPERDAKILKRLMECVKFPKQAIPDGLLKAEVQILERFWK